MVEQDAVDREHAVGLAVVPGHPVGVDLGGAVRRARVERRLLVLRRRRRAEHLRARRLVEAALHAGQADRLEQAHGADAGGVTGVLGLVEADPHVRLRGEVVDLVGVDLVQQRDQAGAVGEVAVVQEELGLRVVRVLVEVVDPGRVERRGPTDQPVDLVPLAQQQLGQVGPVLPGDSGDECALRSTCPLVRLRGFRVQYPNPSVVRVERCRLRTGPLSRTSGPRLPNSRRRRDRSQRDDVHGIQERGRIARRRPRRPPRRARLLRRWRSSPRSPRRPAARAEVRRELAGHGHLAHAGPLVDQQHVGGAQRPSVVLHRTKESTKVTDSSPVATLEPPAGFRCPATRT